MQTIYYTTTNFVTRRDNIVDLNEYRRRLALTEEGSLAPQPEGDGFYDLPRAEDTAREMPSAEPPRPRRSTRRERRAWLLDICASLSVVVMTAAFTLHVLL